MTIVQVMPPASKAFGENPCTVNGRTYTVAVGSVLNVPDFDANVLEANGWHHNGAVATTAARPVLGVKDRGYKLVDSTLGATITWDGVQWRNPATGAIV